jgi:hypothetical protein
MSLSAVVDLHAGVIAGDGPEEIAVGVGDLRHVRDVERLVAEIAEELARR